MPATLTSFLERNDKKITSIEAWIAEHAHEGTKSARIEKRVAAQRRKLSHLMSEREILVKLASPQAQIDSYGAKDHTQDFLQIGSLQSMPGIDRTQEELRNFLWSLLKRNTPLRRFQELFSKHCHLVIPQIRMQKSVVTFTKQRAVERASLRGCIASPDRIPEKLCEDLQLCNFDGLSGNPIARLERISAMIPQMKLIWEAATPLVKNEQRLLIVSPPSQYLQQQYGGVKPPSANLHGSVLYVREVPTGKPMDGKPRSRTRTPRPPRRLTAGFFPNAYKAQRATGYKAILFLEETRRLSSYKQQVAAQRDVVNAQWAAGDRAAIMETTQTLLAECVTELQYCRDVFKLKAKERLEKAATFKDSKDRENVTVALTQMTTAIEDMQHRLKEAGDKAGFNTKDALALESAIEAHELDFRDLRAKLTKGAPKLQVQLKLFQDHACDSQTVGREVQGLLRAMELDGDFLPRVTLRPFTTFRRGMEKQHDCLKAALSTGNRADAVSALTAMHILGKFQAASTCTERMRQLLMDGERIPIGKLQHYINLLRKVCEEREVFPECNVQALEQPFSTLFAWVQRVESMVSLADTMPRPTLIANLKEVMDQCDPEAMVMELLR